MPANTTLPISRLTAFPNEIFIPEYPAERTVRSLRYLPIRLSKTLAFSRRNIFTIYSDVPERAVAKTKDAAFPVARCLRRFFRKNGDGFPRRGKGIDVSKLDRRVVAIRPKAHSRRLEVWGSVAKRGVSTVAFRDLVPLERR